MEGEGRHRGCSMRLTGQISCGVVQQYSSTADPRSTLTYKTLSDCVCCISLWCPKNTISQAKMYTFIGLIYSDFAYCCTNCGDIWNAGRDHSSTPRCPI